MHDRPFIDLRYKDLQEVIDNCPLKHASMELILVLFHQMYDYAEMIDLCDKDYSARVKINKPDDDEQGVPFSDDELKVLWKNKDNPTIELLLIMCYSGFRVTAYKTLKVNLSDGYFCGGLKTPSGKNRIVPIHSGIFSLVEKRISRDGKLLNMSTPAFRDNMYKELEAIGLSKHTPHDCRHTFSRLCMKYQVLENDRKRMLGHAFQDVSNKVYGHRDLEDLRREIEKIEICC